MEARQGVVRSACCCGFLIFRQSFEQAVLQCSPGHTCVHTANRVWSHVAQTASECCLTDWISTASSEAFTPVLTAVGSLRTDVNIQSEKGRLWVFLIWNFCWSVRTNLACRRQNTVCYCMQVVARVRMVQTLMMMMTLMLVMIVPPTRWWRSKWISGSITTHQEVQLIWHRYRLPDTPLLLCTHGNMHAVQFHTRLSESSARLAAFVHNS